MSVAVSSDVLDNDGSEISERFEPSGRPASGSQLRDQPDNGDEDEHDLSITPTIASREISHTLFERTRRVHEDHKERESDPTRRTTFSMEVFPNEKSLPRF